MHTEYTNGSGAGWWGGRLLARVGCITCNNFDPSGAHIVLALRVTKLHILHHTRPYIVTEPIHS